MHSLAWQSLEQSRGSWELPLASLASSQSDSWVPREGVHESAKMWELLEMEVWTWEWVQLGLCLSSGMNC